MTRLTVDSSISAIVRTPSASLLSMRSVMFLMSPCGALSSLCGGVMTARLDLGSKRIGWKYQKACRGRVSVLL